jgi:copper transport protein
VLCWTRHRAGRPTDAARLVLHFSRVATVALLSVAAAGIVMAIFVLDSFGDLTGTEWGQILLLKLGAVAIAATLGAYNHFRLLPRLEAGSDDPDVEAQLRGNLVAESIVLLFVVVVTAWLVAAAT